MEGGADMTAWLAWALLILAFVVFLYRKFAVRPSLSADAAASSWMVWFPAVLGGVLLIANFLFGL